MRAPATSLSSRSLTLFVCFMFRSFKLRAVRAGRAASGRRGRTQLGKGNFSHSVALLTSTPRRKGRRPSCHSFQYNESRADGCRRWDAKNQSARHGPIGANAASAGAGFIIKKPPPRTPPPPRKKKSPDPPAWDFPNDKTLKEGAANTSRGRKNFILGANPARTNASSSQYPPLGLLSRKNPN